MLPDGNIPMRVAIAPIARPGEKAATVSVVLGVHQPVPEAAKRGRVTDTTELQITAYSPDGKPHGTQRHTANVVISDGAEGEAVPPASQTASAQPTPCFQSCCRRSTRAIT